MPSYQYTISIHFGGDFSSDQFKKEIQESPNISTTLVSIDRVGDTVLVIFDDFLTALEEVELNLLVTTHNPGAGLLKNNYTTVNIINNTVNVESYFLVARCIYKGSNAIGNIESIEVLTYMDLGIVSYDIRVINRNSNKVLAELTGRINTDVSIQDLGPISNIPEDSCILEFQVRKNGGIGNKKVYVEEIRYYHKG